MADDFDDGDFDDDDDDDEMMMKRKCDAIKHNESEVEKCFFFLFFSISYLSIV